MSLRYFCLLALALLAATPPLAAQDLGGRVEKPLVQSFEVGQQAQKALDDWDREHTELVARYKSLAAQVEQKKALVEDAEGLVQALMEQAASLTARKEQAARMADGIMPFLFEAVSSLKSIVEGGEPFLAEERRLRVEALEKNLADLSVPPGEKFRKVMEAFFLEAEYGNTLETYRDLVQVDGQQIRAIVFRFGRVALFCQSLDGARYGIYEPAAGQWQWLASRYAPELAKAFAMAGRQRPANIVTLPLGKVAAP
ncbi:MAG: DUF3450 domain-containing protein [Desulfatibacillaceae bacterium]|nr:DUF3450 domain-containing protein [Desulfatibacillaceae bacterium]